MKTGFHSKAVAVVHIQMPVQFLPLSKSLTAHQQNRGQILCNITMVTFPSRCGSGDDGHVIPHPTAACKCSFWRVVHEDERLPIWVLATSLEEKPTKPVSTTSSRSSSHPEAHLLMMSSQTSRLSRRSESRPFPMATINNMPRFFGLPVHFFNVFL